MKQKFHFNIEVVMDVPDDAKYELCRCEAEDYLTECITSGIDMVKVNNDCIKVFKPQFTYCTNRWHWCKDTLPISSLLCIAVTQVADAYGDMIDTIGTVAKYDIYEKKWYDCSTSEEIWPVRWTEMLGGMSHMYDEKK